MAQRQYWVTDGEVGAVFPFSISYLCGRNGSGLRGYRQVIASHGNATTPFTGTNCTCDSYIPGDVLVTSQSVGNPVRSHRVRGWLTKPAVLYTASGLSYTNANNRALAAFYANINEAVTSFQGGSFLGEIGQTIRMLKRPMAGIRSHLNGYLNVINGYVGGKAVPLRHRPTRNGRNVGWTFVNGKPAPIGYASRVRNSSFRSYNQAQKLQVIGSTWLEWRFGINPLVKDVQEVLSTLGKLVDEERLAPVKAFGSEETPISESFVPELYNNFCRVNIHTRAYGRVSVRYKGQILIKANAPGLTGLAAVGHFGPRDWMPTLWELTPYSWAVDYFLNVSDMIRGLVIDLTPLSWYARTIRREVFHDVGGAVDHALVKAYLGKTYRGSAGSPGFTRIRTTHIIRDIPALGLVKPEFKLPTWPASLMNMAAVVIQSKALAEKLRKMS